MNIMNTSSPFSRGAIIAGKTVEGWNVAGVETPLRWRVPRFAQIMSDLFHEGVPFEFIDRVFAAMALTRRHTYQVLTKRPERMADYLRGLTTPDGPDPDRWDAARRPLYEAAQKAGDYRRAEQIGVMLAYPRWPLRNVWLGTSVERQEEADERIPHLLRCPAAVRFLSCEPLLEGVDLAGKLLGGFCGTLTNPGESFPIYEGTMIPRIDWIIAGGESGPSARPCNVEWIRSIVGQCKAAGVACFVKQVGSNPEWPPTECWEKSGPPKDHKGGNIDEFPPDLRVREFPNATVPA